MSEVVHCHFRPFAFISPFSLSLATLSPFLMPSVSSCPVLFWCCAVLCCAVLCCVVLLRSDACMRVSELRCADHRSAASLALAVLADWFLTGAAANTECCDAARIGSGLDFCACLAQYHDRVSGLGKGATVQQLISHRHMHAAQLRNFVSI